MTLTQEQIETLNDKFFTDPDWKLIEQMLEERIRHMSDLNSIDTSKPAEAVHAQVTGRQIEAKELREFLQDCGLLSKKNKSKTTFK